MFDLPGSKLEQLAAALHALRSGQLAERLAELLPLGPPRLRRVTVEIAANTLEATIDTQPVQALRLARGAAPGELLELVGDAERIPLYPGVRVRGPFSNLKLRRGRHSSGAFSTGALSVDLIVEQGVARYEDSPTLAGGVVDWQSEVFASGAAYAAPTAAEGVSVDGANRVGVWLSAPAGQTIATGLAGVWWFKDPITGLWAQSNLQDTPATGQRAWAAAGMRLDVPGGRVAYRPGANTSSGAGALTLLTIASE